MRHTFCGTLDYISPEMAQGSDYDMKLDNWAIGVLTYEFLTGKPPFETNSHVQKLTSIKKGEIKFPSHISWEAQDFISKLLEVNPNDRMSLESANKHIFIQKYLK